jgi:fatty acid desaturase/membrane-associated phospholipid phosphatase
VPDRRSSYATQNWLILSVAVAIGLLCLWTASHAASLAVRLGAAVLFSFSNNTVFSLLHEAVHGKFSAGARSNAIGGSIAAAFFPTSMTVQTAFHLTHHRNNRSDLERFDYIAPHENVVLKTAQWFTILTGVYWISIPVFCAVYFWTAEIVPWRALIARNSRFSAQTSAGEFFESVLQLPLWRVRGELLLTAAVQLGVVWALDLSLAGWLLCYLAFALNWSSLQYADHAFSALDRLEGSWNLRVNTFTRLTFLNYHYHQAHHIDPSVPWQRLPSAVSADAPPVSFLRILYLMWSGPRLLPGSAQTRGRETQLHWMVIACHVIIFGLAFLAIYGFSSVEYQSLAQLHDVATRIDALIPFVPWMSVVYLSLVPIMLVVPLVLRTPEKTLPFVATLLAQLVIAAVCFHLYPVALPQPPAIAAGTLAGMFFSLADTANMHGNGLPSLHVAFALSCAMICWRELSRPKALLLALWSVAISLSTLLTYQHYLMDVTAGVLLAGATMFVLQPMLAAALISVRTELLSPQESTA